MTTFLLNSTTLSNPTKSIGFFVTNFPSDAGRGRGGRDNDRRSDRGGRGGHGTCWKDVITHLSCNCGGTDINSTYRQCLVSTRPSTTFFTASVIDSCIEVIIGLPDIRMHRLIHRIPSYFDTPDPTYLELNANVDDTTSTVREATRPLSLVRPDVIGPATNVAMCRGASPCKTCVDLIAMGYDNTLCSLRDTRPPSYQRSRAYQKEGHI